MENPFRVQAKENELNIAEMRKPEGSTRGPLPAFPANATAPNVPRIWQAVPGYFTMTGFDFNKGKGAPTFNPNFGVPLKIFQNSQTGELRTFSAYLFENN